MREDAAAAAIPPPGRETRFLKGKTDDDDEKAVMRWLNRPPKYLGLAELPAPPADATDAVCIYTCCSVRSAVREKCCCSPLSFPPLLAGNLEIWSILLEDKERNEVLPSAAAAAKLIKTREMRVTRSFVRFVLNGHKKPRGG